MKQINNRSVVASILLVSGLLVAPGFVTDSHAARKCQIEDRMAKKAQRDSRKATSESERAERGLFSLTSRYERSIEGCEDRAMRCANRIDRLNDSYTAQLNRAEADRQRYIADSVQLGIQRAACEFDLMIGGGCNPNRFYSAIARMGQRITRAEQRIATLRKLLEQKLNTQRAVCVREQSLCDTKVARALTRVQVQQLRATERQAIMMERIVVAEVAEQTLLQCMGR